MEPTTEKKSNGALIGSIIVILLLIMGGVYVWMTKMESPEVMEEQNTTETNTGSDEGAAAIKAYDELNTLEQDLNSDTQVGVDVETIQ